ncbi:hypothetical protein [Rubripirellula reticaptiva]|uniref:Uncharacterized protein n=1 Tax=Rubripirellula reticaptiva TaxID=2528013 RepID=A0A5C6EN60_9BACT|nr:hypothetical protein [Rubripirellula reticaptiva]TWU49804.1 hypothetical protein Poly59_44290 [Rubripirellula reticaptiva]
MKLTASFILGFACILSMGCGNSGEPAVVTDGIEQSAIDEYNRMQAESEAEMMKSVNAESEAIKADPKGLKALENVPPGK